jgi:hypothetical protein
VGLAASGPLAERLARAQAVLRHTTQRLQPSQARRRADSVPGAGVIPVADALRPLLPEGGLRHGSVVRVPSPTSLLFALLAEASTRGMWCALVGMRNVGLVAAAEAASERQRLAARARQGGAVLLPTGPWPAADLELAVVSGRWQGLGHDGHGRLRSRQVQLRASGRGMAHRQRNVTVLLPDPTGKITQPSRSVLGSAQDETGAAADGRRAG